MKSHTVVEQIAAFATMANSEHLDSENRYLLKRNTLDSLGCAIGALSGPPFHGLRAQFSQFRSPGACTLIGGGMTSLDQAALYNSGLVRYVDMLDSYMGPGGLCHPSDNFAGVLATADAAGASGQDFLLALAVAYEVGCRLTSAIPVMGKGFNHALQLAISLAAGCGRLMGLDRVQTAHAIAIAAVDNVSLGAVHSEPVSMWKGSSPGITAMRVVYTTGLAKRGFTGPLRLFEGPNGLEQMFDQSINIDWGDSSLDAVQKTMLKTYSSLIHGQPVIQAVLKLRRQHDIDAGKVSAVRIDMFQSGFDIAGGGAFGPKDHPSTKEQGDYNLRYLVASALLDNEVGPAQLDEARINSPEAQALLSRVTVAPADEFTAAYPGRLDCRVVIELADGQRFEHVQHGFNGDVETPFSWARTVDKFEWLAEPYADGMLRRNIIDVVHRLEERYVADLMAPLGQVHPGAVYLATLPGIQ